MLQLLVAPEVQVELEVLEVQDPPVLHFRRRLGPLEVQGAQDRPPPPLPLAVGLVVRFVHLVPT